jgi:hypothetical protein
MKCVFELMLSPLHSAKHRDDSPIFLHPRPLCLITRNHFVQAPQTKLPSFAAVLIVTWITAFCPTDFISIIKASDEIKKRLSSQLRKGGSVRIVCTKENSDTKAPTELSGRPTLL